MRPLIEGRNAGGVFDVRSVSVSKAFTRACRAVGIEDLHFHDLRHRATARFFRISSIACRDAAQLAREPSIDADSSVAALTGSSSFVP
ncbi:MAG: hypothetical protein ABIX12_11495 [Rubrivivax sp.]